MARRLRSNRENGWYHVYHRGIERCEVFLDDLDREHFLKLLGAMSARYRVVIHAFALMDNHWHGVVRTPDANLSAAMQWLHLGDLARGGECLRRNTQDLAGAPWRRRQGAGDVGRPALRRADLA